MDLPDDLTLLLHNWQMGNQAVTDQLFEVVYNELANISRRMLAKESDATMQTSDLVNSLFIQLQGSQGITINDRRHFFGLCGRVMRRIIMQHARKAKAEKRGGLLSDLTFQEEGYNEVRHIPLTTLDEALAELAALGDIGARQVRLIELRFFVGLEIKEAAELLGVSEITSHRDWKIAKAWLLQYFRRGD